MKPRASILLAKCSTTKLYHPLPPKARFGKSESLLRKAGPERINCKDEKEPGRTERTREGVQL
jgi:hypothetical protein